MKKEFTITRDQFVHAFALFLADRSKQKMPEKVRKIIGVVLLAAGVTLGFMSEKWYVWVPGFLLAAQGLLFVFSSALKRRMASARYNRVPKAQLHWVVSLEKDGLTVSSGENTEKVLWTKFNRAVMSEDVLLLFIDHENYFLIPLNDSPGFTSEKFVSAVKNKMKDVVFIRKVLL